MNKKNLNFIKGSAAVISGIVLGIAIAGILLLIYDWIKPSYECKKKIEDKKVVSRFSGKFFLEDGTVRIVDKDDYTRYMVGDEFETMCKGWKK